MTIEAALRSMIVGSCYYCLALVTEADSWNHHARDELDDYPPRLTPVWHTACRETAATAFAVLHEHTSWLTFDGVAAALHRQPDLFNLFQATLALSDEPVGLRVVLADLDLTLAPP